MLGVAACFNNFKPGSRSDTNTICKAKNQEVIPVKNTSIFIKKLGRRIVIPCGLVAHKVELESLINNTNIQTAIQILIKKYNIPLPTKAIQEIKRYVYPTANKRQQFPVLVYYSTFRLAKEALLVRSSLPNYVMGKSYILEVCNDDTVTFSDTALKMSKYATYWFSTLNLPCYCIIQPTNGQNNKLISGYLSYNKFYEDRIIFTSLIFNTLYLFYEEYERNTAITILYKTKELSILTNYLNSNNLLDNFRNNAFNLL